MLLSFSLKQYKLCVCERNGIFPKGRCGWRHPWSHLPLKPEVQTDTFRKTLP